MHLMAERQITCFCVFVVFLFVWCCGATVREGEKLEPKKLLKLVRNGVWNANSVLRLWE